MMQATRRLAPFLRPYWLWVVLAPLAMLLEVMMDLLQPWLIEQIIDDGIAQQDMALVLRSGGLMVLAALIGLVGGMACTVFAVLAAQGSGADLRHTLFGKVQALSFGNLDQLETGKLITRLTNDVTQVQELVMMLLRIMVRAPLLMVGSLIMAVLTSPQLALLFLVLLPVVAAILFWVIRRTFPLFGGVQRRLDALNIVMQENLAGVRVVKAFVREDHEIERFGEANEALTAQSIRVYRLLALLMPLMMVILNAAVIVALWFGGRLTVEGSMTVGEVVASVNYLSMALFPLMMLAGMVAPLAAADASASRILEVLDSEPDVRDRPGARALEAPHGRVAFEDVGFGYTADGGAPVLQGVSFVAEPGETVAILGATGSGKSTLIHLIPRFYDVTSGRVTLDGVDVRDLTLASLRSTIGIALQEAVLFSGTVRDNVRYGRPDATQAEIEAAAEAAQAAEFIAALPDGYDTVIGERGVTLSGGQRQRLAIARALVVRPKVLILDDSTSAVDIETEVRLQDAMDRLIAESARATTRFIVAQRISTVLLADKILVLDGGRIAASGTHADLLASSAVYREIYESQLGDGRGASEEAHRG